MAKYRYKSQSELVSLRYVTDILTTVYTAITNVDIPEYETDGWDIYFTASTPSNNSVECAIEVKRCKGNYSPDRYTFTSTPSGNTAFEINHISGNKICQYNIINNITHNVPQNLQGKQIYMLNASVNLKDGSQSFEGKYKWKDIQEDTERKVYVAYLWKNALIILNPNQLNDSFEGYYWYNTTFVNQADAVHFKQGAGWQRKAAINLSKGTLININMPDSLYKEIYIPIYNNVNKNQ